MTPEQQLKKDLETATADGVDQATQAQALARVRDSVRADASRAASLTNLSDAERDALSAQVTSVLNEDKARGNMTDAQRAACTALQGKLNEDPTYDGADLDASDDNEAAVVDGQNSDTGGDGTATPEAESSVDALVARTDNMLKNDGKIAGNDFIQTFSDMKNEWDKASPEDRKKLEAAMDRTVARAMTDAPHTVDNVRTMFGEDFDRIVGDPTKVEDRAAPAADQVAPATDQAAAQDGAAPAAAQDGAAQDGAAQDGAAQDGAAQDGAAQDGAAQDGAAQDGAAQDGAAQDGADPAAAQDEAAPAAPAPAPAPAAAPAPAPAAAPAPAPAAPEIQTGNVGQDARNVRRYNETSAEGRNAYAHADKRLDGWGKQGAKVSGVKLNADTQAKMLDNIKKSLAGKGYSPEELDRQAKMLLYKTVQANKLYHPDESVTVNGEKKRAKDVLGAPAEGKEPPMSHRDAMRLLASEDYDKLPEEKKKQIQTTLGNIEDGISDEGYAILNVRAGQGKSFNSSKRAGYTTGELSPQEQAKVDADLFKAVEAGNVNAINDATRRGANLNAVREVVVDGKTVKQTPLEAAKDPKLQAGMKRAGAKTAEEVKVAGMHKALSHPDLTSAQYKELLGQIKDLEQEALGDEKKLKVVEQLRKDAAIIAQNHVIAAESGDIATRVGSNPEFATAYEETFGHKPKDALDAAVRGHSPAPAFAAETPAAENPGAIGKTVAKKENPGAGAPAAPAAPVGENDPNKDKDNPVPDSDLTVNPNAASALANAGQVVPANGASAGARDRGGQSLG